jgi:hypothetical protein
MGYLFYIDDKILENFRKHGFNIEKENISQNLLNTKISIQQFGVTTFLLKAFENFELTPQDISFELLLSQIPELEKAFAKTTLHMPNVAQKSINENYDFVMECPYYEEDKGEIFEEYGIVGTYNKKYSKLCCYFNIKGKDKYFNNENLNNNLFYKDYIILPNKFVDGIHDINLIYYCYLTIMGYGMLVRYNSNKWEKFIDPKISNESSLIEMSINTCVNHFLILLHQKILGYTYIEERYDDKKVIKVIKESTPLIMKEINKNIERRNLVFNSKTPLPWPNSQEVVY